MEKIRAYIEKIRAYIEDVIKEMKKVKWPERRELVDNTILVLVSSLALSLFIFVVDRAISTVLEIIYR